MTDINYNTLKASDFIKLSCTLLTARDKTLERLKTDTASGIKPVDLSGSLIFFAGPASWGDISRLSIGPTTSLRMAGFIEFLLDNGVAGFIGKGRLPEACQKAIIAHKAVYFQAIGGAGAFYGSKVKEIKPIAFTELGTEAVFSLTVEDFPVIVSIDSEGNIFSAN